MNSGKIISGIVAFIIYLSIIFSILFFYNIHKTKAKNYVEKNSDRVTVTLVNSDKTVFNKSEKVSTPKKPVAKIIPPIPKKVVAKKVTSKKIERTIKPIPKPKKVIPKKNVPKKVVPKKPKKVVPKPPKKIVPKRPKKVVPKKKVPKKVIVKRPKKVVPKPPKKVVTKRPTSSKDLFSSVTTKVPVKKRPKPPVKHVAKVPSSIKHNSSITDRIKATHQSGRISNANRDKGTENRYKKRVFDHMNNWNAVGAKDQMVTVKLTVYQSGKFKYRIVTAMSSVMKSSLKRHLDILNRQGLGRHRSNSAHTFTVNFHIRP